MEEKQKKTRIKTILHIIWKFIKRAFKKIQPSLIAVAIGLLAGIIVMLIFNPERTLWGFGKLLLGGFAFTTSPIRGFGNSLHQATPIILTGLAIVFAFRTGLFNIGTPGQMMIGAYVAVHVGVTMSLAAPWHWIIGITLGMIAGGLYGLIPGLLKAFRNVNEVVSSIMLNWIAANLLVFLIGKFVLAPSGGASANIKSTAQMPFLMRSVFNNSQLTIGFLIAIVAAIIVHIILYKTTLGFQLRASGFSVEGSKYAGMNTRRNIILAMTISGMLAGLAGAVLYSTVGKTIPRTVTIFSEGFEGISVALLGLGEPIGAIFAGLFLSHIKLGGNYMQPHFVREITDMIIGVIIYSTAISIGLQLALQKNKEKIKAFFKRKKEARMKRKEVVDK
ncbi:MAG: ABC transporter permease [Acholeplasmataceae bacterium]|nr:ABC transporter permease [Acholeplasmataceae bacterium]